MFTGIIKEVGRIKMLNELNGSRELTISCNLAKQVAVDQSICINGVCHTVTAHNSKTFTVLSVEETLRKTNMGELEKGDYVNLERSLQPNQLLDGHWVQGHVDDTGTIHSIEKEEENLLLTIEYPRKYKNLIVARGSVTVDGISLTIASENVPFFTIAIIPYTFNHTNLQYREKGDKVNLEFDILGKYVIRYLENRQT